MIRFSMKLSGFILVTYILSSFTCGQRSNVGVFTDANGDQIIFFNFVPYLNSMLNVSAIASKFTANAEDCQVLCTNTPRCLSVNVALAHPYGNKGGHLCQLLPAAKSTKPDRFGQSKTFHHFDTMVSVSFSSCLLLVLYPQSHKVLKSTFSRRSLHILQRRKLCI